MKAKDNQKPELLAPAGNLECAIAALQSGADAVYAGISRFNAREMGENFTFDDMSRLSAHAKKLGRKLYLTLNTLIKENELEDFGRSVEKIAGLEPDAVIIQDIGAALFLKKYFPQLTLHGSTQMGIHNSAGVKTAQSFGIERVILERQITMTELSSIVDASPLEIEVFVHGALCCSVSGHCLFSSWMGGWSGNRGRCKQPCRRRFHSDENGTKKSGFFFSTQDYYSLDMLDELTEAGVSSLKIEGRLKKADYVKNVVTAYRMMLDCDRSQRSRTLGEARNILSNSYGRKWSHGFMSEDDMAGLIHYESPGVSGMLAGEVVKTANGGFTASVSRRLHIGDRIRIQTKTGDEGPAFTITKMNRNRQPVNLAVKGDKVFINCDKEIAQSGRIYKIGDTSKEAVKVPKDLPLYSRPAEIDISIKVNTSGMQISISGVNGAAPGTALVWEDLSEIDTAEQHPLSEENLQEAFTATREAGIRLGNLNAEITGELFLPAGRLKKLRRGFWEWAVEQMAPLLDSKKVSSWLEQFNHDQSKKEELRRISISEEAEHEQTVYNPGNRVRNTGLSDIVRAADLTKAAKSGEELLLPFFCPESRLADLKEEIINAYRMGIRRFRISSIAHINLLKEAGITKGGINTEGVSEPEIFISTGFPLAAANSYAAEQLKTAGADKVQLWLELDHEAVTEALKYWPVKAEIYRKGKPFLLATRASVSVEGSINDSRGKFFTVETPAQRDIDYSGHDKPGFLSCIFPQEVLALPEQKGCSSFYDFSRVNPGDKETEFNYDFSLI